MTMTLPYRRQQVTPRSGGRIAGDRRAAGWNRGDGLPVTAGDTIGNTALAPTPRIRESPDRPALPRIRVAPPVPVTVPRAPFVAMVLVVVIAGVVGILVLNTKINENAFRLEALQQQQGRLDRAESQLTMDLADKESPGNLAAAAKRLGLGPAGRPAFIRLPDGKILGVPRPASDQPGSGGTANATAAGQTRR